MTNGFAFTIAHLRNIYYPHIPQGFPAQRTPTNSRPTNSLPSYGRIQRNAHSTRRVCTTLSRSEANARVRPAPAVPTIARDTSPFPCSPPPEQRTLAIRCQIPAPWASRSLYLALPCLQHSCSEEKHRIERRYAERGGGRGGGENMYS